MGRLCRPRGDGNVRERPLSIDEVLITAKKKTDDKK